MSRYVEFAYEVTWDESGDGEVTGSAGLRFRTAYRDHIAGDVCLSFWSPDAKCNIGIPVRSIISMEREEDDD